MAVTKRDRPWILAQLALAAVVFGLVVQLGIKVTNGRERIEASRAEADFDCRYTSGLCYVTGFDMDTLASPLSEAQMQAALKAANSARESKMPSYVTLYYEEPPARDRS
jgi:hypothetical protein